MRAFAGMVNDQYKYTMFCSSELEWNPPTVMRTDDIMRYHCDGEPGWYFFEGTKISNYEHQWVLVLKERSAMM